MPERTDHPPDGERARTLRGLWTAVRVILALCTLLHHWRDDC